VYLAILKSFQQYISTYTREDITFVIYFQIC